MTRTKARSCTGKTAYTKAEAKRRADDLYHSTFARVHAYNCDFCDSWHVGHKPIPKRKGRRAS